MIRVISRRASRLQNDVVRPHKAPVSTKYIQVRLTASGDVIFRYDKTRSSNVPSATMSHRPKRHALIRSVRPLAEATTRPSGGYAWHGMAVLSMSLADRGDVRALRRNRRDEW